MFVCATVNITFSFSKSNTYVGTPVDFQLTLAMTDNPAVHHVRSINSPNAEKPTKFVIAFSILRLEFNDPSHNLEVHHSSAGSCPQHIIRGQSITYGNDSTGHNLSLMQGDMNIFEGSLSGSKTIDLKLVCVRLIIQGSRGSVTLSFGGTSIVESRRWFSSAAKIPAWTALDSAAAASGLPPTLRINQKLPNLTYTVAYPVPIIFDEHIIGSIAIVNTENKPLHVIAVIDTDKSIAKSVVLAPERAALDSTTSEVILHDFGILAAGSKLDLTFWSKAITSNMKDYTLTVRVYYRITTEDLDSRDAKGLAYILLKNKQTTDNPFPQLESTDDLILDDNESILNDRATISEGSEHPQSPLARPLSAVSLALGEERLVALLEKYTMKQDQTKVPAIKIAHAKSQLHLHPRLRLPVNELQSGYIIREIEDGAIYACMTFTLVSALIDNMELRIRSIRIQPSPEAAPICSFATTDALNLDLSWTPDQVWSGTHDVKISLSKLREHTEATLDCGNIEVEWTRASDAADQIYRSNIPLYTLSTTAFDGLYIRSKSPTSADIHSPLHLAYSICNYTYHGQVMNVFLDEMPEVSVLSKPYQQFDIRLAPWCEVVLEWTIQFVSGAGRVRIPGVRVEHISDTDDDTDPSHGQVMTALGKWMLLKEAKHSHHTFAKPLSAQHELIEEHNGSLI